MNIDQIKAAFEAYRPGLSPEVQFLFDSMIALNEQLEKPIQTLENQLAKDSHNPSKPPSSDSPKANRTKSLRTKSKNNPGGLPAQIRYEVEYGSAIITLGVNLQCHHHLPMERACQVMSELFGSPIRLQGRFRKEFRQLLRQGLEAIPLPEKIPAFLLTTKKQSVNVLEVLKDVFSPHPVFYLTLINLLP